jgi:lipoic acid synthetase
MFELHDVPDAMTKPEWLTIRPVSHTGRYDGVKKTVGSLGLNTVCVEARCPNITECWSGGTATFMVLGSTCTRGCRFCSVMKSSDGDAIDQLEPFKLATAIKEWGLKYVVITSVCRDDLDDQGSEHFARCIRETRRLNPDTIVEVLIPDFSGVEDLLAVVAAAGPHVIGNNIETVRRLSPLIRDRRASYEQTLGVLRAVKKIDGRIYTKSAIMLGLGEKFDEVVGALSDLRKAGVDFVAIGQYLKPSSNGFHADVVEYIHPDRFKELEKIALGMGFRYAAAGPFVRSSYRAGEFFVRA